MISRAYLRTGTDRWTWFEDPLEVVQTREAKSVPAALVRLEELVKKTGRPAVGFLTYEAAAAYGLATHRGDSLPLLCFVVFARSRDEHPGAPPRGSGYTLGPWTNSIDAATYRERIERIREHLYAGDTYQVNFTYRMTAPFTGEPSAFFRDMCAAQNGTYAAYLELDDRYFVLSASPELFIEQDGTSLSSLPMKGTAPRGLTTGEDEVSAAYLRSSPKERAENLMITDMIRNDLGRIAIPGTVSVPELFSVQRYPRVLQMVSCVEARSEASLADIMAAVFPCASITGAPKKRTMELIREIEDGPRGIYTGTIGVIYPERALRLNVAIRTVVIDRSEGIASFGVGGGIVWDSRVAGEYRECATKAAILTPPDEPVTLLETLRWSEEEGVFLFEGHLARLRDSARYFGIPLEEFDHAELHRRILGLVAIRNREGGSNGEWRVRLLLDETGMRIEAEPLYRKNLPDRTVALCTTPISERCLDVRHKTTRRTVYETRRARHPECDDVLLCNTRGNLTESTTANIVIERHGENGGGRYLATPPPEEGLLAGVFRDYLLMPPAGTTPWTPGSLPVVEEVVPVSALEAVRRGETELYLVNSVRGWMRASLV